MNKGIHFMTMNDISAWCLIDTIPSLWIARWPFLIPSLRQPIDARELEPNLRALSRTSPITLLSRLRAIPSDKMRRFDFVASLSNKRPCTLKVAGVVQSPSSLLRSAFYLSEIPWAVASTYPERSRAVAEVFLPDLQPPMIRSVAIWNGWLAPPHN